MKGLIISPRLDVTFKSKTAPSTIGKILYPEIRKYWEYFAIKYKKYLIDSGEFNSIDVISVPLGSLTPSSVIEISDRYDVVYVPHRQKEQFDCGPKAMYYMQMVFPWLFSVDNLGWCAGSSFYPIQPIKQSSYTNYDNLSIYCNSGKSKFLQKNNKINFPESFILYTLQVPNDMTIQYHSNVSVLDAMTNTLEFGQKNDIPVLVKCHPGLKNNLKSLFINKTKEYKKSVWLEDCHILECIQKSSAVATVNSGTGMEAIMQNKPVFVFGNSEYDSVAHKNLTLQSWEDKEKYIPHYKDFIETYCNKMFDVGLEK